MSNWVYFFSFLFLLDFSPVCCFQDEHRQDMEDVLVGRVLTGLGAVRELGDTLKATAAAQRDLANKVPPTATPLRSLQNPKGPSLTRVRLSQVEDLQQVGVFLGGLARDLSALREASVDGLGRLRAGQAQLEEDIRRNQETHKTVRDAGR